MPIVTFETPEGDDITVDSDEVLSLRPGQEAETTIVELDDGSEVTVVATALEAAADLSLDPLDVIEQEPGDEDEDEDEIED